MCNNKYNIFLWNVLEQKHGWISEQAHGPKESVGPFFHSDNISENPLNGCQEPEQHPQRWTFVYYPPNNCGSSLMSHIFCKFFFFFFLAWWYPHRHTWSSCGSDSGLTLSCLISDSTQVENTASILTYLKNNIIHLRSTLIQDHPGDLAVISIKHE